MSTVADPMKNKPTEYCRYTTVKIDSEVARMAKAAALVDGKTIQEWVSDHLNDLSAQVLGREPIKRKPPKPRDRD
ncbi:MAG: hypothetical protein KGL39_33785 [Patescibacteria group bacterium]|nr:hypothetical protein [Patescibacteria group bacterium]